KGESHTGIEESLEYAALDEHNFDIQGPTSIRSLLDTPYPGSSGDTAPVWYGFAPGDAYPTGDKRKFGVACEPNFQNRVYKLDSLPATIEGIVTLEPQHYEKISMCGEDHRYYGSYFIQDATGSILVLKDSRISDFSVGDRVKLDVRGVTKQFGRLSVAAFDDEKVVKRAEDRETKGAPYERLTQTFGKRFGKPSGWARGNNCWNLDGFNVPEGFGNNYRVTGRVCREPNSRNFNELVLQKGPDKCVDNPKVEWTVSMGLELGRRGLGLKKGDVVTVTGPVYGQLIGLVPCKWTFRMIATTVGQFKDFSGK
ncbi:MAG: hypothetical protein ABEN55_06480, partial [Bradymonadaceae bacterium]